MPRGRGWFGYGGWGRGVGWGRGWGRGLGISWGFGFRGSSPPWPYVGRGRGGLPRCGYYTSVAEPYYAAPYPTYADAATPVQRTREEELSSLKHEAQMLRQQLEQIDARARDLETK
jgi:hypothetical protein